MSAERFCNSSELLESSVLLYPEDDISAVYFRLLNLHLLHITSSNTFPVRLPKGQQNMPEGWWRL